MFSLLRNKKIVEVSHSSTPSGQPIKSYQFVRSSSTSTKHQPSTTATTMHRPSSRHTSALSPVRPAKDTFRPLEGEDLPVGPHRRERLGSDSATYHPLPPIIHQRQPAMIEPNLSLLLDEANPLQSHPHQTLQLPNSGRLPALANHSEWPDRGHTPLIDMEPQHARVITRVPKPKLNPVVRVHSRATSHRATSKVRSRDGRHYHCSSASNSTSEGSRRTRSSEDWEADSWAGDGETEWGSEGVFSDADSWDGKTRVRTIGPGRGGQRAIEEGGGWGRGVRRIEGGGWNRDVRRFDDRGWAPEKKKVHYVD